MTTPSDYVVVAHLCQPRLPPSFKINQIRRQTMNSDGSQSAPSATFAHNITPTRLTMTYLPGVARPPTSGYSFGPPDGRRMGGGRRDAGNAARDRPSGHRTVRPDPQGM